MADEDHDAVVEAPSLLAAKAALETIGAAVHAAQSPEAEESVSADTGSERALAALLLLRELRNQLAGWETGLVETARAAGVSWADLAGPLGVASRQAAERRYLRLRPGAPGTTGEQRIRAARDRRAADRAVTAWARGNAVELRRLAGQISALADLPASVRAPLDRALGSDDAAALIEPLADARRHLGAGHAGLAGHLDALTDRTDRLREDVRNSRG